MQLVKQGADYVLTIDDPAHVSAIDALGTPHVLAAERELMDQLVQTATRITRRTRETAYDAAPPAVQRQVDTLLGPFEPPASSTRSGR